MKNPAAVALGKESAKKRFKGKSKKQISQIMAKVRGFTTIPSPTPRTVDSTNARV